MKESEPNNMPNKYFLHLFIVVLTLLMYMKLVFDIIPPPTGYVIVALPFLGFATYHSWDIIMKYKVFGGVALIVFLVFGKLSIPEKKKQEEKKCIGTEQCESAVIQRLESTGSMHLGIRYEGNGVFTGYATKYVSGPTFKWSMKTDCNCEIINSNTDLIK